MTENDLLKKIALAKVKPAELTDISPRDLADLVLVVLQYAKEINQQILDGKIRGEKGDAGYNPIPNIDYLALPTAKAELDKFKSDVVSKITSDVQNALSKLRNGENGKDAQVTQKHIREAANLAFQLIELPDFSKLITQEPESIRNSLELLQDDERLDASAIKGLDELLKKYEGKKETLVGGIRFLSQLADVRAINLQNNDVLKWNSTTQLWENGQVSGGTGAVDSVNGETGIVVLDADDIDDTSTTQKFVTAADLTKLSNLSGTNTGDQDLTPYFNKSVDDTDDITIGSTNKFATAAEKTKLGNITVTQAVDLDAVETNSNASKVKTDFITVTQPVDLDQIETDTATNNAKTGFTNELAQDAVGGILTDTSTIDFTYDDAGNTITADVKDGSITLAKQANMATASVVYRKTAGSGAPEVQTLSTLKTDLGLTGTNSGDQTSIVGITGTKAQFDTAVTDGNILYVGDVTQYTDELAQDAVGAMVDSSLTYVDATPLLQRAALTGAITASAGSNTTALGSFTKSQLDTAVSDGNVVYVGDTITLSENTSIALDPAGSADGKWSGISITGTAGYTQAFGDLVYLDPTDSRWEAVDANSASGADGDARGMLAMVVSAGTDGNACTLLLQGVIRADAKFPTFTVNNPIYASETAGSVTQTQPTTTDVVIRVVGFALTADEMYFNPSPTYITHT